MTLDATIDTLRADAQLVTERQIRWIEDLPAGDELLGVKRSVLVVRHPDGKLTRVRPSGRRVAARPVARSQSYLDVAAG